MSKCKMEGCNNEVYKSGLCKEHINDFYDNVYDRGVYKLYFENSNYFYIGKAVDEGINVRFSKHKNYLAKQCLKKSNNEERLLLKYFNKLCDENNNLTRTEVFEKFVKYERIYPEVNLIEPIGDATTDDLRPKYDKIMDELKLHDKKDSFDKWIDTKEKELIEYYKELDKKNGTNYLLNTND